MCDDGSFYWHVLDFADDFYDGDCPDLELTYRRIMKIRVLKMSMRTLETSME